VRRLLTSWWSYLGLTLASALFAHLVFDAIDSGLGAVLSRPIHLVYAAIVVLVLGIAAREAWHEPVAEMRRRYALRWARLRSHAARSTLATVATQLALAVAMFALEGGTIDGPRVFVAALCALIAIIAGTVLLRSLQRRVVGIVAGSFTARRPASLLVSGFLAHAACVARPTDDPYVLFRANRPPPIFA